MSLLFSRITDEKIYFDIFKTSIEHVHAKQIAEGQLHYLIISIDRKQQSIPHEDIEYLEEQHSIYQKGGK